MAVDPEQPSSIANHNFRFHEPLDRDSRQIRLLTLAPEDTASSAICCTLTVASLDDGAPLPRYEALSYCWGDKSDTRTISLRHPHHAGGAVEQQSFTVTANLANALGRLRSREGGSRTLWVDAICINQDDVLERSHQVSFMRSVYGAAERTLVWLGEDDGTVGEALELLVKIVRQMMHLDPSRESEPERDVERAVNEVGRDLRDMDRPGKLISQSAGLPPLDSAHWTALARLLSRAWFRRLWVVQEVAVSQAAIAYCGEHEVDWICFELAGAWLARNNVLSQTGNEAFRAADNLNFIFQFANPQAMKILGTNPLPMLALVRDFEATDPRDKVFATLSLMFNTDVGRPLAEVFLPDYTLQTESIYRRVMWHMIQQDRNLDALCMVQPFRGLVEAPRELGGHNPLGSLPVPAEMASWIARWEYGFGGGNSGPLGLFPPPKEGSRPLYQASSSVPLSAITLKDPTEPGSLLVRGLKLDRIISISKCIWANSVDIDIPPHPIMGSIARSRRNAVFLTWIYHRQQLLAYPTGENAMTVLRLLMVANRTRMKNRADEDALSEADFAAYVRTIGWDLQDVPVDTRKQHSELLSTQGDARRYSRDLAHSCNARSVFGTSLGYLGLCHVDVQVGDIIVMLFGGKVLYVLRPRGRTWSSGQTWKFLGEAYLHGQMDGTAFSMKRASTEPAEIFDLR